MYGDEHYATGYMDPISEELWSSWLKNFCFKGGVDFKQSNECRFIYVGVLTRNGILHEYTVKWRHMYNCFHGGKPRYKSKQPDWKGKPRNAPGSCLMECKAALYTRLLKTSSGLEILHIKFPLLSAHTTHFLHLLADLQSHKPLPEIQAKIE